MIWCRLLEAVSASTSTQAELVHGREQRERQRGVCGNGRAASSLRGRAQRAVCLHSSVPALCSELLGLLTPSSCCGNLQSAKPYSISQLSSQPWESRRGAWAVLMAVFHFSGWAVVVGSAKAWVLLCPLQFSLRVQDHRAVPPFPSLPALSPSIWPVSKGWLPPGVWDIVCNSLGLIHARWFYWQPRD